MQRPSVKELLASLPTRISDIPRRWAKQSPQNAALHELGESWSYVQLCAAIDEAHQWLVSVGISAGDRVMLVSENCRAHVALIFALAELDAWSVSVNARLSAQELNSIQKHSGAACVIYSVAVSQEATHHARQAGAEWIALPMLGSLAVIVASPKPEAVIETGEVQHKVATLIYTTGTTGQPKGVMLTHRNLLFVAATAQYMREVQPADRVYGVLPMSHVFGLSSVMLGTLYSGASLDCVARYAPQTVADAITKDGITIFPSVPAMCARLLAYGEQEGWSPVGSRLRYIYAGGAPLDLTLKQEVEAFFALPLHNGYGMTESGPTISQTRLQDPVRLDASVGKVVPGVEIRVLGLKGESLGQGEQGELWVRGPNVMKGYYREAALTQEVLTEDGWLNTGDVVRIEPDGALFIEGRTKELIIRSGFNVYPIEVEAALNSHPAVMQSAVVGRSVALGNEEVIAFVEEHPDLAVTEEELTQYLAGYLSPYKVPSKIVFMKTLPAAATGKVLKAVLKKHAESL